MNVTATSIDIAAPAAAIYDHAAATARWPLILPHYRYVRVHQRDGMRQIVEMAAWRDIFPLHWVAEQINDAERPHISFRHIAGPTRGMDVGAKNDVINIVRDLRAKGLAIIVLSTEPETVLSLADRIVVMKRGAVVREFANEAVSKDRLLEAA